ncbi:MAG TPA: hypothetical protein PLG75_04810, partial [Methanoculleus sp.]|nr:hypothetical protein [Methanoculleus sp.]
MTYHESCGIIAGPSRTSQRHFVVMETVGELECLIEQNPRLVPDKPPHDHNLRPVQYAPQTPRLGSAAFFQVSPLSFFALLL